MKAPSDKYMKIPIVEQAEDGALLFTRKLRGVGYAPKYERRDTAEFSSVEALAVTREAAPDLPVIVVSGITGEEFAVEAVHKRISDYIPKDNLKRMAPAIDRELTNTKTRSAQRATERAIEHIAYRDSLTGLVNRREFEKWRREIPKVHFRFRSLSQLPCNSHPLF